MNTSSKKQLANQLQDPEQRHLYVEAQIETGLPLQLRAMREQRGWTQTELAERARTTQNAISRLESPGRSGHPSIQTLLRMAEVFDVALVVGFFPFSRFLDSVSSMDRDSVAVPSFDNDIGMIERKPVMQGVALRVPDIAKASGERLSVCGPVSASPVIPSWPTSPGGVLRIMSVPSNTGGFRAQRI